MPFHEDASFAARKIILASSADSATVKLSLGEVRLLLKIKP